MVGSGHVQVEFHEVVANDERRLDGVRGVEGNDGNVVDSTRDVVLLICNAFRTRPLLWFLSRLSLHSVAFACIELSIY